MIAVFKHELSSYFSGLTGYVFGAFILLFAGIYTMVYNLQNLLVNFEYAVASMSIVYLVAAPILSMRILAEERRQKTDQLLYSLPLTMTQVVLGKYFAMLVPLMLPTAIMGLYPLLLSDYGNLYLPAAFGALIAFFFLGAALLAIGMFISSITDSQAVAAGLCFVVMLLNYYISDLASFAATSALGSFAALVAVALILALVVRLMTRSSLAALATAAVSVGGITLWYILNSASFEGFFPSVMEQLSLFERFYGFIDGIFSITGLVYFASVIGLFLFLSVQSMEKRRWSE